MSTPTQVTRRAFLETAGAAGAGLVISFYLPSGLRFRSPTAGPFAPNAWLRIGEDESVLVIVDRSEMGQGVTTALPMLLAEELEADWSRIRIEFAPADKAYTNPMFGMQGTGGSTSVRAAYTPLRKAGAAARELLGAAAAQTRGGQDEGRAGSAAGRPDLVRRRGRGGRLLAGQEGTGRARGHLGRGAHGQRVERDHRAALRPAGGAGGRGRTPRRRSRRHARLGA